MPGRTWIKRALVSGAAAAAVLLVVAAGNGGSGGDAVSASKSVTTLGGRAGTGVDASELAAGIKAARSDDAQARRPLPGGGGVTEIPLEVRASSTRGLRDGDAVSVRVEPKDGAAVYGFEAFLCKGGESYRYDADVRPTLTGKCVTRPLSDVSQDYLEVRAVPPYTSAEASFRVGTGTDTFHTGDGRTATVTCGRAHPCTLVLKLQFPNGFGFQTIPLIFK